MFVSHEPRFFCSVARSFCDIVNRMEVRFFDKELEHFIETLEKPTISKVMRMVDSLEELGHRLRMPHSKHIGGGLFELRVRGTQEVRIMYVFHRGTAVLIHGFLKKSQGIPRKDLEIARQKLSTLDRL